MEENTVRQFKKGGLELILLCLIAEKERYGYELLAELDRAAPVLGFAREGTVYPILYRLQSAGLLACRMGASPRNGGTKKYYSLTEKGRAALTELASFWNGYAACVEGFLRRAALKEEG